MIHSNNEAITAGICILDRRPRRQVMSEISIELSQQLLQISSNERDPVATLALDGKIMFANSSALSAIDSKLEEVIGQQLWELPWWDGDSQRQAVVRDAFNQAASGEVINFGAQYVTQEGLIWFEHVMSPVCTEAGSVSYLIFAGRSIENRKATENALRTSEHRYKALFENAKHPVMLMSDSAILDCSDATATVLGYSSKHDIIGLHPAEFSPSKQSDGQDSRQKADNFIATALQTGCHEFE
ncbi:MAG TPA: PAS domain S-box protein [Cycloclasticus sp.]|nr:PAS domain S-box protein [Cycloclasticus sp.]